MSTWVSLFILVLAIFCQHIIPTWFWWMFIGVLAIFAELNSDDDMVTGKSKLDALADEIAEIRRLVEGPVIPPKLTVSEMVALKEARVKGLSERLQSGLSWLDILSVIAGPTLLARMDVAYPLAASLAYPVGRRVLGAALGTKPVQSVLSKLSPYEIRLLDKQL